MKVDNQVNYAIQNGETTEAGRARKSSRAETAGETAKTGNATGTGAASSEISPRAKEFAQAKKAALDAPDVREAKIQELRDRIARREYNVKPEDIADRMLKEHASANGLG